MPERESKVKLVYETDRRGLSQTIDGIEDIEDAYDDMGDAATASSKAVRDTFSRMKREIKDLKGEVKKLGVEFDSAGGKAAKIQDTQLGVGSGSTIAGFTGKASSTAARFGVGRGVNREISGGIAIAELKQSLPELKKGLSELGVGMNKATLATGLLGGGLIGLGIIFAALAANAREARQEYEQVTETERERVSLAQESTDSLLQLQKELNSEIATANELGGEEGIGAFERARETGASFQAAGEAMIESNDALEVLETRLGNINDELATRNQLETNAISLAQSAGESIRFMQEAETRGIEATEARILAIENETAQIEAQLEVLRNSGDDSEEVTAQIEALNAQLGRLGAESSVATKALNDGTAAQVDAQKELERSIEEAAKTAEQSALKIEAANTKYADSIKNIGTQASQALSDAKIKAKESAKDLATTLSDDLFEGLIDQAEEQSDILRESRRDDAQELRDSNRELKQIRKDGFKSERDAARDRNFLALAESREDTREQLSESAEAAKEERDERQIALDEEFADLRLQSTRQRGERLRDFGRSNRDLKLNLNREFRNIKTSKQRQLKLAADALSKELKLAADGANKKLTLEQEYWKQSLELIQKALKSVGGAGARTSGRAPTDALAALGLFD